MRQISSTAPPGLMLRVNNRVSGQWCWCCDPTGSPETEIISDTVSKWPDKPLSVTSCPWSWTGQSLIVGESLINRRLFSLEALGTGAAAPLWTSHTFLGSSTFNRQTEPHRENSFWLVDDSFLIWFVNPAQKTWVWVHIQANPGAVCLQCEQQTEDVM